MAVRVSVGALRSQRPLVCGCFQAGRGAVVNSITNCNRTAQARVHHVSPTAFAVGLWPRNDNSTANRASDQRFRSSQPTAPTVHSEEQ